MTTFPVIDVAMDFLREGEGEERYAWVARADEALNAILDMIFSLDQEPLPLVDELLRLACALGRELGSPSAASYLIAIVGADQRVQSLLTGRPDEELRALDGPAVQQ